MTDEVMITSATYETVLDMCRDSHPAEVCGLIGTREAFCNVHSPVQNVAEQEPGKCGFLVDSRGQLRAMRELEDACLELGAIYHSHPHAQAVPSGADISLAAYLEAIHLIVGLLDLAHPELCV